MTLTSSEPGNQKMEVDIEKRSLTRPPIASYREKTNNRNNLKDLKTLYPDVDHLDESEDFNTNDDTHSVQNGLEDQEGVEGLVSNSPNESEQLMVQLNAHSSINVGQGPSQNEARAPLRAASVGKEPPRRRKIQCAPIQQPKRQISYSPERSFDLKNVHRKDFPEKPSGKPIQQPKQQTSYSPERSFVQKSVHREDFPEKTSGKPIQQPKYQLSFSLKRLSIKKIVYPKDLPGKSYNYFILAGIVFVAIIYAYFNLSEKVETVAWNYQSIVSSFTPRFKGQPEYSFKIFKSALKAINQTEPSAPAVILFLASKGAENLARNLGEKLVDSVSTSPIKIYGKDYQNLDSDSGKKHIDDALRRMKADSDSEYGAVLVEDLHLIPGETALMFHTYCDNENAPFKHAVYALIVHMEEAISVNSKMKDWDIAVYKRLNRAWRDIDEDQRGPLLSRLTVSVAAILENNIAG